MAKDNTIEIHFKAGVSYVHLNEDWSDEQVKEMITRFQRSFLRPASPDDMEFIYCLVGNIVDKHVAGKDLGVVRGTKQFAPGTKVYCSPTHWGDGAEYTYVIGKPRKRKKLITVVTQIRYIKNWRLKKVYDPFIISEMVNNFGWTNHEDDKKRIEEMLEWLPSKTIQEIESDE
ncbi:hypothetical protein OB69_02650 [Roseivirga seohaensis subsp. aquiponti]|uniref:Uncharacterized protein n=1 Tax=Roseivirga seohaensis subsp. aquiponti TaxID=1566026 RepID=A0A0L8AP14_9BACT|nr:hypothetical protein [Roseivirga seohaensis]KOF03927.1 hypothetical protein OB69_02650 [Roseivirga seohaensis subsp. aquiponti]